MNRSTESQSRCIEQSESSITGDSDSSRHWSKASERRKNSEKRLGDFRRRSRWPLVFFSLVLQAPQMRPWFQLETTPCSPFDSKTASDVNISSYSNSKNQSTNLARRPAPAGSDRQRHRRHHRRAAGDRQRGSSGHLFSVSGFATESLLRVRVLGDAIDG